jgi:hypothetical protein
MKQSERDKMEIPRDLLLHPRVDGLMNPKHLSKQRMKDEIKEMHEKEMRSKTNLEIPA